MDLLNSIFLTVSRVMFVVTYFSSYLQIVASVLMLIKIWRNRKASGFSYAFQCLCIMAFGYKYLLNEMIDQRKISSVMDVDYFMQYWTRILILICMVAALCMSFYYAAHDNWEFEDEFEKSCIPVGLIVSFVLGTHGCNKTATTIDFWTTGSYLEVIAWIPQLRLSLKKQPVKWQIMFYIISMFIYDILNFAGFSYDFYRNSLYGNVGYNLSFLKFLLFCGFFFKYWVGTPRIENNVNATTARPGPSAPLASKKISGPKKGSDKSIYCIDGEDNVSKNEKGLATRY